MNDSEAQSIPLTSESSPSGPPALRLEAAPVPGALTSRAARRLRPWKVWITVAAALALIGVAAPAWLLGPWTPRGFTEIRMPSRGDIPIGIAAARDGTIWFSTENGIGRLRGGTIEQVPRSTPDVEPLGLAVDADGTIWYTDAPRRAIARLSPDGRARTFPLDTSIARLGRLAIAHDGAVWFAEPSTVSVTRLKDGAFKRFAVGPPSLMGEGNVAPFGVAVDAQGTVWATLQNANQLVRIAPAGDMAVFDVPTPRSGLGDVAVDTSGAVWFLELAANKVGRLAGGRFQEFAVPTPSAGLVAIAAAPDGAVWFTELRGHKLGRVHQGGITEFPLPRGDARPFGLTVDARNNVWYTDLSGWVGRLSAHRARG